MQTLAFPFQAPETASFTIKTFYDPATYTLTFVVYDPQTKDAVVIDPVFDYDPAASSTSTSSVDQVCSFLREQGLFLHYILETHAHADHLSGSQILAERFGAKVAIGTQIRQVQKMFKHIFGLPEGFQIDGSQFDRLLEDGEIIEAGSLRFLTINTPGHTPACVSYLIGDALFTGDALFMHDYGTGRCDFPGGDAKAMYHSIHERLYSLPDETRVFVGHDYQPENRPVAWETTIGRSKRENPQLRQDTTEEEFVAMRNARDAKLAAPKLLFQSVQVNIDAGKLPSPEQNHIRYLRIPVNVFRGAEQKGVTHPECANLVESDVPRG